MIHFKCLKCGADMEVPESLAGQTTACPGCGNINGIPGVAAPAPTAIIQPAPVPAEIPHSSSQEIKTNVKQGAIIGGWLCFVIGMLVMHTSVWLFVIYGPVLAAALVLSIVAMAQRRIVLGMALLLSTIIVPPVCGLIWSAQRTRDAAERADRAIRESLPPDMQRSLQGQPSPQTPPPAAPQQRQAAPPQPAAVQQQRQAAPLQPAAVERDNAAPPPPPVAAALPPFRWAAAPEFYTSPASQIGVCKVLKIDGARGESRSVSFSPDGTLFAYVRIVPGSNGNWATELVIRDWATREIRSTHTLGQVNNPLTGWSPDANRVIVIGGGTYLVDRGANRVINLPQLSVGYPSGTVVWPQPDKLWLLSFEHRLSQGEVEGWEVDLDQLTAKENVHLLPPHDAKPGEMQAYEREYEKWHGMLPKPLKQGQFRITINGNRDIMVSDMPGRYSRRIGEGSEVFVSPDSSCVLAWGGGNEGLIATYLTVAPSRTQYTVAFVENAAERVTRLKALMAGGEKIYVQVHTGSINPLNQKIIGIENNSYVGDARVLQVDGNSMRVAVAIDLGMKPGLVASGAFRKKDSQWREEIPKQEVWGRLDEGSFEQVVETAGPASKPADKKLSDSGGQEKIDPVVQKRRQWIRLNPDDGNACNELAWTLATRESSDSAEIAEAVELAQHAVQLAPTSGARMDTLAAAYAASGRFPEAIEAGEKAIQLASAAGKSGDLRQIQAHVERFRAAKPWREGAPAQVSAATPPSTAPSSPPPPAPAPPAPAPAVPKELALDLGGGVTMNLKLIPSGKFTMGSHSDEAGRRSSEGPEHDVAISKPFYMGVCEVTQEQYQTLTGRNPSSFKAPTKPVEMVSWNEAVEFCRKLSQQTGRAAHLPTEAQWEYACRAGTSTRFNVGDSDSYLDRCAWYSQETPKPAGERTSRIGQRRRSGGADNGDATAGTHPVAQKQPNAWGLYDMHGNVWEWCFDWCAESYDSGSAVDPTGPGFGTRHVLRGGSWFVNADYCRSACRGGFASDYRTDSLGFRVAVDVK